MSQDTELINRMRQMMTYKSGEITESVASSIESMREGVDGNTYAIVREGTNYFIKKAETTGKKLVAENFDYVGGFNERSKVKYTSFTNAAKNLDLMLREIRDNRNSKAIIIESTNPAYKETLITEATGEMSDFIKRQRQIMANMKVIEEGYMAKPIGDGMGHVGDSAPFGEKANGAGLPNGGGEAFNEKPAEAKENGEPAKSGEGDGMKTVPGADKGKAPEQKPVMQEGVEEPEEEILGGAKKGEEPIDTPAAEEPATEEPKEEPALDTPKEGEDDSVKDMLTKILDRVESLEAKVEKIPFECGKGECDNTGIPAGDEEGGDDDETIYRLELDDEEGDEIDLGEEGEEEGEKLGESAASKFPWLNEL